jgi:hypothetical protein
VQVPVNTWQAYDTWGGTSLYQIPGQAWEANRVSFDRPYNDNLLGWEYPLVLFLEQRGYNVAYQTDVDTDADPSSLLGYRLVIVTGHSEYWTSTMRDAFDAARDSGVNLAFMGSNAAYWQIRYENDRQVIVGYKSTADPVTDPKLQTVLFRSLTPPRPECDLMGIQHQGGSLKWNAGDYSVVASSLSDPWMAGTGFDASSVVRGVVGVETDTIPHIYSAGDSCGHRLTVFFHRELGGDQLGNADAVAYTAPNGAVVFDAGSKRFSWGLADGSSLSGIGGGLVDPRLQRFAENLLNDLSSTLPSDLAVQLAPDGAAASGGTERILATITNHGPGSVRVATLDVDLPAGVRFVRVSAKGLRCTVAPVHCTLAPFPAGTTVTAVFVVRPGRSRRPVTIEADVSSAQAHDPDAADERARLLLGAARP